MINSSYGWIDVVGNNMFLSQDEILIFNVADRCVIERIETASLFNRHIAGRNDRRIIG